MAEIKKFLDSTGANYLWEKMKTWVAAQGYKTTDTNTWRDVVDNLTSTATDKSLSAKQGKVLNDKIIAIIDGSQTVQNAVDADSALYASEAGSVAWANITGKTNATTSTAGLMSATDKSNLDTIVNSFISDDADTTIETVKEVLKVFESYPAGTSLSNALAGKLDKTGGTLTGTVTMTGGDFLARYVGVSEAGHETSTYDKIAILSNTTNGYIRYRTKSELLSDIGAQAKVSALGSNIKPVYISAAGTFSETKQYAGGTWVTLNGVDRSGQDAYIYAPTAGGTSGQVLTSGGSGKAPTWVNASSLSVGSATNATQLGGVAASDYATQNWVEAQGYKTTDTTYTNATTSAAGLMSAADKTKLDGIASGANNFSLPVRLATASSGGYADPDSAIEQGWHYITQSSATRPPFKQVDGMTGNDYRVMTTAYGSTWLQQIATDYRSNDIFTRRLQNGTWQGWTALVKMQQGLASPVGTDNAIARWDATRNATIQDSKVTIDDNGVLDAPTLKENGTALSNKYLTKTTYEYNKEIAFGSTGKLYIGAFPMYDSNITVEISATTSTTYNATLVIATQNINTTGGGTITATVYGDATNTIAPNIYIGYASGSNQIHVYFSPQAWSKNLIHIQAVSLAGAPSNVCSSVDSIPSTANRQPTNALTANFQAKLTSGTNIKTINGTSLLGSGDITISGGSGAATKLFSGSANLSNISSYFSASYNTYLITLSSAKHTASSQTGQGFLIGITSGTAFIRLIGIMTYNSADGPTPVNIYAHYVKSSSAMSSTIIDVSSSVVSEIYGLS